MTANQNTFTLANGTVVPKLAYGTGTKWFKRSGSTDAVDEALVESILTALRNGFTHIDTAESYGTEKEVGIAFGRYLEESGKKREDFYITTKVLNTFSSLTMMPSGQIRASNGFEIRPSLTPSESYVDLYLIHSPFWDYNDSDEFPISKVWATLSTFVTSTRQVRSLGVSNWRAQDYEALLASKPAVLPQVNQIEFHAYIQNKPLQELHKKLNVVPAAYGPLQPLIAFAESGLVQETVTRIAVEKGNGTTASQVLLAWGFAQNTIQVTTSAKEERLKEAVAALNVELTPAELDAITKAGEAHELRKFWVGKKF
ncbi:NADP-dependent oxidoreductase domain-containing protein [Chytriomyces sp. MP71]|nr:NADP-dependent oxidoreductase domain-containing protein [Chytriomyces sp. MP71]